ncbi:MAG TPA: aldolase/citrate lyase family protein [Bacteroidales bacterium]|nr:aldolase/citrate lyase family protein [Bacteroidales bacterium]
MRSLLFVPGHNEKLFNSASGSDADVLLLDIEDSVQPQSNKQVARDTIQKYPSQPAYLSRVENRPPNPDRVNQETGSIPTPTPTTSQRPPATLKENRPGP